MNANKSDCDVSVIVVNWNGGELLSKCIASIAAQSFAPKKVFLVDNNSTDNSLSALPELKQLKIIKLDANYGFAVANNRALAECSTKYVALLNPDALAEPAWLENLVRAAEADPTTAIFGSLQMMLHETGVIDGLGDIYHLSGLSWRRGYGRKFISSDAFQESIFSACACAALYRTEAMQGVGGFDEDYFCYFEDVDLGFRLRLAGHKATLVPGAVVLHSGSASTGGKRGDFSIYHAHRNLVWTFFKNMPSYLFWILLPVHLALNFVAVFYFIAKGKGPIILKSKWHAVLGLPKMLRKRRLIQQGRLAAVSAIWISLYKSLSLRRDDYHPKNPS